MGEMGSCVSWIMGVAQSMASHEQLSGMVGNRVIVFTEQEQEGEALHTLPSERTNDAWGLFQHEACVKLA